MEKVKTGLRLFVLVLLLILAVSGIGITGNILNSNKERFMDNELRNEQPNKKEDEENEDEAKN